MEPVIQFAPTEDGLNIAFWQMGDGPPLMLTSPVNYSHIGLELRIPQLKGWYERLAESWRVIRFDARGWGLSDRRTRGYDLEMTGRDIDAVARAADAERFALFGFFGWGPATIAYAATRPERVTHLLTWLTDANAENAWTPGPQLESIARLRAKDWELYTENVAHVSLGWRRGEAAHEFAELIRASASQEFLLSWRGNLNNDSTSHLPNVRRPTLILHSRDNPLVGTESATRLASAIPGARLKILEGRSIVPYGRLGEEIVAGIADFMGVAVQQGDGTLSSDTSVAPVGVILFADIADSTGLTERLGDVAFRAKARDLDAALRTVIRQNGGTPVEGKLLGDGVLAVFTSARQAIEAALVCGHAGYDAGLHLHLGLHAGDVIREEGNVYGGAVNIASRISGLSAPGEVLVSETVRSLARTSAGVRFEDRGEQALKGVGEPVRVWAVRQA